MTISEVALDPAIARCRARLGGTNSLGDSDANGVSSLLIFERRSHSMLEVDEAAINVGTNQRDLDAVTYVQTLESAHHTPFDWRLENPHPCSLRSGTCDDSVETCLNLIG